MVRARQLAVVSRVGFRWPAAQRGGTERSAWDDGRPDLSEAEPYRIYIWIWPKSTFSVAIAPVVAVTMVLCAAKDRRRLN